MKIRSRLLVVAIVPAVALAAAAALAGSPVVIGLAAAGALAAVLLASTVARTITDPLGRLGEAADRAARLQGLVDTLRRGGSAHDLALAPVGLPAGSEIGDVGVALDSFQAAAAKLALGQAALLNKSVADKGTIEVFVNLARRIQGLVDHQIEFLDALEAEEQDPDTLEELFRLDQLATRVRRNAESLLTLSGTTGSRSWERPLAMADVIRAGMAEVEDIARIDLLVDDDAAIVGNVAADAAHLLSELLENATRWSPPDTRVEVTGMPAAGGYAISIEDAGVGMTVDALAEANHILTGPPLADTTVARSLGLVVAGRLARRLGVTVRLAAAGTGGIVAKVLLPAELLVAAEDAGLDTAGPARTLPFALARAEKRSRISSQRSRGRRGAETAPAAAEQQDATITRLPTARWDEPTVPEEGPTGAGWDDSWSPAAPEPPAEPARGWDPEPAPPARPWEVAAARAEWDLPAAGTDWDTPAVVEPASDWDPPAAPPADPGIDWDAPAAVDPGTDWDAPAPPAAVDPGPAWDAPAQAVADNGRPAVDPGPAWDAPTVPEAPVPAAPAEPSIPVLRARPPAAGLPQRNVPPERRPVPAPAPEPAPPAAEVPAPRAIPTVRPARFAAASSKPLAGEAPPAPEQAPAAAASPKEEEYRLRLERATAAGLVRRVPKASLPKDTGGTASRVVQAPAADQSSEHRLPDQVRSLLSSYRAGVQRGRVDEPAGDDSTTSRSSHE